MNFFHIAYYTILRNFRDTKTLIQMLLFPVVLILILGMALGNSFAIDKIDKINVNYLNEDVNDGQLSGAFVDFLKNDVKDILEAAPVSSFEEGIKLIREGKAQALIHIEKDFTQRMLNGEKQTFKVYNSQQSSFRASIVKNIIDSFIDNSNAYTAASKLGVQLMGFDSYENIEEVPISTKDTMPRAIDYYAVTMLVMTLMVGTLYGGQAITYDKLKHTYIRLNTAPVKQYELVLGQIFGTIVTLFLQAVMIIVFTKFAYKADWGDNIYFILFVCISIIILAVSMGIMMFSLVKSHNAANGLLFILVQIFTFISGGYVPIYSLSSTMEKVSLISPNYLAQQAMFNSIFSGPSAETQSFLIAIWAASTVMFLISAVAGRRIPKW